MRLTEIAPSRTRLLLAIAIGVAATVVGAVGAAVLELGLTDAILLGGAAVALVIAFVLPVHVLPAVAVVVFTFLPTRVLSDSGIARAVPLSTLLLLVWVFRRLVLRDDPEQPVNTLSAFHAHGARLLVYIPAALVVMWVGFTALMSMNLTTSVSWTVAFLLAILTPLLVPDIRREGIVLRSTVIWCGALMGAYALGELLLQSSPLYGSGASIDGEERTWSVYRSRGSFSHPLFAGAFLTIPAMLGLGEWVRTGRLRYLLAAGFAVLGVFSTVARGSIIAVAGGAVVLFLLALTDRRFRMHGRMLVYLGLGVLGLVFAASFGPLQSRTGSVEASLSEQARELGLTVALRAAAVGDWLGTGPGTSGQVGRFFDDVVIENSLLQLLISVGIPGLICVLLLFVGLAAHAAVNRDWGVAAAIVSLGIALSSFNLIDAVLYMHFLLTIVVLLSLSAFPHAPAGAANSSAHIADPTTVHAPYGGRPWT